ncbi:hypothetical protein SOCEGT47_036290 [Sorangium cellulosum]|uniref:Com family DNA-binding transcriptional regulator n=1 Tax=Sorangium cellulosum TaxID=56 RepID=A0A4P2Q1M2_SORCE|nr:hypothetical protein [Sorangium cellulosum]AUX23110.1 hypothetical protein SOCEGT47_036290 [Sorangium cellulosum]
MSDPAQKERGTLGSRCVHCGVASDAGCDALRCDCGSMLARLVPGGIELKCRRCKRVVVVPLSAAEESAVAEEGATG